LNGSDGPGLWVQIVAAVLADTGLLGNPFGAVRAFPLVTDFGGKPSSVVGTELIIIGVSMLASGAGFHGRVYNSPAGRILGAALPQTFS
jgi:hypothetical protein